jgi:hypothetical protein
MYQDLQSTFSQAQTVVGTAGVNILSTNVIDMGKPANTKRLALAQNAYVNNFDAEHIPLEVQVVEALAGASGGVRVEIIQSATDNMASPDVLYSFTIPQANFVVGYRLAIRHLPMGITKQFIALRYVPLTTNSTAGKLTSYIPTAKQFN